MKSIKKNKEQRLKAKISSALILYFFIGLPSFLFSQSEVKLNLSDWISEPFLNYTSPPFDIGSISDVFDGNTNSLARTPAINPLVLTIQFETPIILTRSRIMSGQHGKWQIETAETLDDFDNQTGSHLIQFQEVPILENQWNEQELEQMPVKKIRLILTRTVGDDYVHLREWELFGLFDLDNGIEICPPSVLLEIGDSYKFENSVSLIDPNGYYFPVSGVVGLSSSATNVVGISGEILEANQSGTIDLTVSSSGFSSIIPVCVSDNLSPMVASQITSKVAVIIEDPQVPSEGNQFFHDLRQWNDPLDLTNQMEAALDLNSHGAVDYEIVSLTMSDTFLTRIGGEFYSVEEWHDFYEEPGWATLNNYEQQGLISYDYESMLDYYGLCNQVNIGSITEVWIWSHAKGGMFEARMAGEGAFWINGPIITDSDCIEKLPIMGLNYERNYELALHSMGHRVENVMKEVYGRWDYTATDKNRWEVFSTYNVVGEAHSGNIHFPPNGTADYDYGNTSSVTCFAQSWDKYPFLGGQNSSVNCSEWSCNQEGFMNWWYDKLPHFEGLYGGKLNNWWHYFVDYDEAIALENSLSCNDYQYCARYYLSTKIYLEGPYNNNGLMDNELTNLIPLTQPYNVAPYNYYGDENLAEIPSNVVDWVLVEMRSGTPSLSAQNTVIIETKAGLLLNSGEVVNTDGVSPLPFQNIEEGASYHICIRHRNHLDVISSESVVASNEIIYDFTTAADKAFGEQQLKELDLGTYGLFASDFNQDGLIQSTDYDLWFTLPALLNVYSNIDANLDGVIQATDYDSWFANKAKVGAPEIQF